MYSLETLALVGTHDTGWRQANTKAQHNTTQKSKKNSNMGLTKIQVLVKRKQFLIGEDSQSSIHRSTIRMSPCGAYRQLMAAIYFESDTCMHQECSFHAQFLYLYRHLIRWNIKLIMLISKCHTIRLWLWIRYSKHLTNFKA
jgi:hypothetical protein